MQPNKAVKLNSVLLQQMSNLSRVYVPCLWDKSSPRPPTLTLISGRGWMAIYNNSHLKMELPLAARMQLSGNYVGSTAGNVQQVNCFISGQGLMLHYHSSKCMGL